MIDLHLHTTASDGTDTPAGLVRACRGAGITTMAVTDHDTTAALPEAAREARNAGIVFVPGIELTSVWRGSDVHVLGYFIDPDAPALRSLLDLQIQDRLRRARAVGERLAGLGVVVDVEALIARFEGRPLGRPMIADAMVEAGHVASRDAAFEAFLGEDKPAYVARSGVTPAEAVAVIREAGGLASLAHPGVTRLDDLIPGLAMAGLDALEVYHADHSAEDTARYLALARQLGLAVTGGSDYHGVAQKGSDRFGTVQLPAGDYEGFRRRRRQ